MRRRRQLSSTQSSTPETKQRLSSNDDGAATTTTTTTTTTATVLRRAGSSSPTTENEKVVAESALASSRQQRDRQRGKKKVSFCDNSTVLVYEDDGDNEVDNNDTNNAKNISSKLTYQEEKLMDAPSKIRLETSNELKHQRAKMKEKLSHVEEQFDQAKKIMLEGRYRECASVLENVVIRELAERINARQFQMNLEKLRFQRHRRLAILEEQTRVGGGKFKRKSTIGNGMEGRSDHHLIDAEMMMTTTTTTTTTKTTTASTMDVAMDVGEDDSVSGKKKFYEGINATTEKTLRRRSGESSASEASTLRMKLQLGLNTNSSSGRRDDRKSEFLPSPVQQKHLNASVMMEGSTRSSPSTSTDSFFDINRMTQINTQQASSELTATQEQRINFKLSPAPPARALETPQELTMIESALEMCAKAYESMGNKWAAEQKLREAEKIREIITRCDPTTDTVAAVASPLQNFCPIEPTSMNSTLTHQTKLFETRMKQLFSSSVSSMGAAAAASAAASEMQS